MAVPVDETMKGAEGALQVADGGSRTATVQTIRKEQRTALRSRRVLLACGRPPTTKSSLET